MLIFYCQKNNSGTYNKNYVIELKIFFESLWDNFLNWDFAISQSFLSKGQSNGYFKFDVIAKSEPNIWFWLAIKQFAMCVVEIRLKIFLLYFVGSYFCTSKQCVIDNFKISSLSWRSILR